MIEFKHLKILKEIALLYRSNYYECHYGERN